MTDEKRMLLSTDWHAVDDATLIAWDEKAAKLEVGGVHDFRGGSKKGVPPRVPERPFDLEVAKPRAISVERLYQLLGKDVPPDIRAALGATVPILLAHGITPFYKAAERPTGVWGMGYTCRIDNAQCDTVSVVPESRRYDVVHVDQHLSFGLKAGGQIGTPAVAFDVPNTGLSVDLTGASLRATTDQQYAIALQCKFSIVEVQSGPVNAGGARWNLYRGRESMDVYQPLFQTLLVPSHTKKLRFTIDTWIRGSARFFGLVGGREWIYPAVTFDVSLES